MDKKKRGGARPGAGRPRVPGDRINVTLRVSYDTVRYANELRERGFKVNELVERHIREDRKMAIEGSLQV